MCELENLSIEDMDATQWECGGRVFALATQIAVDEEGHYAKVTYTDTADNTQMVLESPRWPYGTSECVARRMTSQVAATQIVFKVFPEIKDQYILVDEGNGSKMCILNPDAPTIDERDAKYEVTRVTE